MQEKVLMIQTGTAIKSMETVLGNAYQLIAKNDGLEAIEWLEKGNHADIIVADVGMPYLSSVDFLRELRSRPALRHVPVLLLSDLDQVTERNYYINAGASDFAVKPLPKAQLKQRIRTLLDGLKTSQQEIAA
jgi:DNA-binding response OmpR family regulator